jgi:hypothetical protein
MLQAQYNVKYFNMYKVYIYVVDRDFGFAPNPFHGSCTLATCKSVIRKTASVGDWVFGLGGRNLKATGKCIYAMKVTQKLTYNDYWLDPTFLDKRPVRNGSKTMMLGDNIYYYDEDTFKWMQAHSHHSNPDGSINTSNVENDTKSDKILISRHFYYFGSSAPIIPENILQELGYANGRNHRVFDYNSAVNLVNWVETTYAQSLNQIQADPFNFDNSAAHYSFSTNLVT